MRPRSNPGFYFAFGDVTFQASGAMRPAALVSWQFRPEGAEFAAVSPQRGRALGSFKGCSFATKLLRLGVRLAGCCLRCVYRMVCHGVQAPGSIPRHLPSARRVCAHAAALSHTLIIKGGTSVAMPQPCVRPWLAPPPLGLFPFRSPVFLPLPLLSFSLYI